MPRKDKTVLLSPYNYIRLASRIEVCTCLWPVSGNQRVLS